jgi:hypothetical protein
MIDEKLLQKYIENGLTDEEIIQAEVAATRAEIEAEAERRENDVRLAESRAARREKDIAKLIELDAAAEQAAADHDQIFFDRQEMLRNSARLEGSARSRWYKIFLEFSSLARSLGDDEQRLNDELRSNGAKVNAVRQSMIYLPPSDVFSGMAATGAFEETKPNDSPNGKEADEMFQLAAAIHSARQPKTECGDYGDMVQAAETVHRTGENETK